MKKTTTLTVLFTLTFLASQAQNYIMSGNLTNVTTCEGFFLDSGGGSDKYSNNEDFTTTFCPDMVSGTHVQLVFSSPDIGLGDDLCFFDGNTTVRPGGF